MPANPVIEVLTKLSAAKLEAMQKDIESQITDLRTQSRWVNVALAEKKGVQAPEQAIATPSPMPKAAPKRRGVKRTGTADLIRTVVRERPEHVWAPAEVIRAVHERGSTSTPQAIRVALRRMHNVDHFLERGPDGTGWRFASSNGSKQEPSSEASNWDPGGMGGQSPPTPIDGLG